LDVGETNTSNKSTASAASRTMIDNVKDYQKNFVWQFNHHVINELLFESTLAERIDVLADENIVKIRFPEIDKETQIAWENHSSQLFSQHGITQTEFRKLINLEPMTEQEFTEDSFLYKIEKPKIEWTAKAKAMYSPTPGGSSNTSKQLTQSKNQHGTRLGPKKFNDKEEIKSYLVKNALDHLYKTNETIDWTKIQNKIYNIAEEYSDSALEKIDVLNKMGAEHTVNDFLTELTDSFIKNIEEI
jgi:hypothetical protein